MNLLRLFHTVRYLRPVQIYGRVWRRVHRPRLRAGPSLEPRALTGTWRPPIAVERRQLTENRFRFLNVEGSVDGPADWNDPEADRLWLYNLHYFDDLRAADAASRVAGQRALVERWIHENPVGSGIGWQPYPTSLRIVNWIKWALAGNEAPPGFGESLATQAEHLVRRLEHHLQGNHLLANAKGLVFAGLYFEGQRAEHWCRRGLSLLEQQLAEQVLSDGGHFERSPMYHALILEDVLDVLNAAGALRSQAEPLAFPGAGLEEIASKMLGWAATMTHPDGEVPFFNDAAIGVAPPPDALAQYAGRLGISTRAVPGDGVEHLAASGYIRLGAGPATAFLDVAAIGPDYIPGHAHADTLSFELSLGSQRVLVNSGTSCYGSSAERLRQRSTLAHNTVCIDGESSSEVWGGFRVARRARPFDLRIEDVGQGARVSCSHDGYRRLPGRPVHRRTWSLDPRGLRVEDEISGGFSRAVASYHLAPAVRPALEPDGRAGVLRLDSDTELCFEVSGGRAVLEPSTYHPEFGKAIESQVLRVVFETQRASMRLTWREL